jgi:predicted nucleic acid-binding protein
LIVVDCSYALALVLPDEVRPASMRAVLAMPLAAPMIWPLEVANALCTSLRRGRLDEGGADEICQRLADLQIDVVAPGHVLPRRHLDAAAAHDLTPYDASYLVLAQQVSAALATRDANLSRAARKAGITIFE